MQNPIRNETSLVLVVAVVLSAVAIPVMSGFLEPSQPPAVAAVQIGDARDRAGTAERGEGAHGAATEPDRQPEPESRDRRRTGDVQGKRRRSAPRPADSAQSAPSAPSAPADDSAEDDDGQD
jgi:hypothetical protein